MAQASGKVAVALDAVSLAGCGWSIYQAIEAENLYFEDPTEVNYQKALGGMVGSFSGCELTLAAMAIE